MPEPDSVVQELQKTLLTALQNARPAWMGDAAGILGEPREEGTDSAMDAGRKSELQPGDFSNVQLAKNNQSVAFVGNLGEGEKIAKAGGPDILLKSLTSADDSVTITTSEDGNEIDLSVDAADSFTIETAQDGSGAGEPLVNATFGLAVWTIHARNIADGTYTRVSQTATDITVEGAELVATNAGGTDGYVLQDPRTYDSPTNTFTITANGIDGGTWISVSQASGTSPIVIELKAQAGSGRRFLAFAADGTPELVGETECA